MTLLLKDPGATLDYSVDWGTDYLSGDSLATSDWTVEPVEAAGASIASSRFDELVATVEVGGGTPGRIYRLTNRVTTLSGSEDSRSIMLRVEKR
jgi:hypothetical protein